MQKIKSLILKTKYLFCAIGIMITGMSMEVSAAPYIPTMEECINSSPYLGWSNEKKAWTMDVHIPLGTNMHYSWRRPAIVHFDPVNGYMDTEESECYRVYPNGTSLNMRITAGYGQHLYPVSMSYGAEIPVQYWLAAWNGLSINGPSNVPANWYQDYGFMFTPGNCGSTGRGTGWNAICAYCGGKIYFNMYATEDSIGAVKSIKNGSFFYQTCKLCNGLETCDAVRHTCQAVSYNQYTIKYDKNTNDPNVVTTQGSLSKKYMYDNNTVYNGQNMGSSITKSIAGKEMFSRPGYKLAGWSFDGGKTVQVACGALFKDVQNMPQFPTNTDGATVTLYAVWEPYESTLVINPGNATATYQNQSGDTSISKTYHILSSADGNDYGSANNYTKNQYIVDSADFTKPVGHHVYFKNQAGNQNVPPYESNSYLSFGGFNYVGNSSNWREISNTKGKYTFGTEAGSVDKVIANWTNGEITLPNGPTVSGKIFIGWTTAPNNEGDFVGSAGSKTVITSDMTLYAAYAELNMEVYSAYYRNNGTPSWGNVIDSMNNPDNDPSNKAYPVLGGKGAHDIKLGLTGTGLQVKLYQKILQNPNASGGYLDILGLTDDARTTEAAKWSGDDSSGYMKEITGDVLNSASLSKEYTTSSDPNDPWKVPETGYYTITAYGANGGNSVNYNGGNGGVISGKVYLEKGQQLDIFVGVDGGSGTLTNGGGSSYVQLRNSDRILAAGGGGGATTQGAGQSGGAITSKGTTTNINGGDTSAVLTSSKSGEKATSSGGAGGGGGWFGGKSGLYTAPVYHSHTGNSSSGGGCYSVAHSHYHGSGCYTNYVSLTGSTGVQTSACGCTSQTWYWRCGYCGATSSSTTNSSAGCRQGHHVSDDGSGLSCHEAVLTCTTAEGTYYTLGCGKSTSTIVVPESSKPGYGGSNGYAETINGKAVNLISSVAGGSSGAKVTIAASELLMTDDNVTLGYNAIDFTAPSRPLNLSQMIVDGKRIFSWDIPLDSGKTNYYYYAVATQNANTITTTVPVISDSAIDHYIYKVVTSAHKNDQLTTTIPGILSTTNLSVENNSAVGNYFLLAAVDRAGNVSPTVSQLIDSTPEAIYNVIVDPNGGVWRGNTEPTTFQIKTNQTEVMTAPIHMAGAIFDGWTVTRNGIVSDSYDENSLQYTAGKIQASVTNSYIKFTAKWNVIPQEPAILYLNSNTPHNASHDVHLTMTEKSVTYNQTIGTLPTPTLEGWTFLGWFKTPQTVEGESQITASTKYWSVDSDIVYAHWRANTYTVVLTDGRPTTSNKYNRYPNAATSNVIRNALSQEDIVKGWTLSANNEYRCTFTYDSENTLLSPEKLYSLTGWEIVPNSWNHDKTYALILPNTQVYNFTSVDNDTYVLYPKYTPITYTVRLSANKPKKDNSEYLYDASHHVKRQDLSGWTWHGNESLDNADNGYYEAIFTYDTKQNLPKIEDVYSLYGWDDATGWYYETDGGANQGNTLLVTDSLGSGDNVWNLAQVKDVVVLEPHWIPNTHTLTYKVNSDLNGTETTYKVVNTRFDAPIVWNFTNPSDYLTYTVEEFPQYTPNFKNASGKTVPGIFGGWYEDENGENKLLSTDTFIWDEDIVRYAALAKTDVSQKVTYTDLSALDENGHPVKTSHVSTNTRWGQEAQVNAQYTFSEPFIKYANQTIIPHGSTEIVGNYSWQTLPHADYNADTMWLISQFETLDKNIGETAVPPFYTKQDRTFSASCLYYVQGTYNVTATTYLEDSKNLDKTNVSKSTQIKVDRTIPNVSVEIQKEVLTGRTIAEIESAIQNGLYTTFTAEVHDKNRIENGDFQYENDSSGIDKVYLHVYDKKNPSYQKIWLMTPSNTVATKDGTGVLSGTYSIKLNMYEEMKEAGSYCYEIYAIDRAGNCSIFADYDADSGNPVGEYVSKGEIQNFTMRTIIYNSEGDVYNRDPENGETYFQVGDIGRIEVWTYGYVDGIQFDFGLMGKEASKEIHDGRLLPQYEIGYIAASSDSGRFIDQLNASQITGGKTTLPAKEMYLSTPNGTPQEKPGGVSSTKTIAHHYVIEDWLDKGMSIRIPPYYQLTPDGTYAKDGTPNYQWEKWEYTIRGYKSGATVDCKSTYILWDTRANDVHYRITHES